MHYVQVVKLRRSQLGALACHHYSVNQSLFILWRRNFLYCDCDCLMNVERKENPFLGKKREILHLFERGIP